MSTAHLVTLGAIAGLTIFLGLPIGRLRAKMGATKSTLNAVAVGILVFLLWDILAHAWAPIDTALSKQDGGVAFTDAAVLTVGFGVGFLGLVWFDQWIARRAKSLSADGSQSAAQDGPVEPRTWRALWALPAGRLTVLIAAGIGLHNFAEGLAIGNSAAAGELTLAWILVIGFATHNATEGFGIVAPLSAAEIRPSWPQLLGLGLIGGGPTLVGTLIGSTVTAELVSIGFLALAAGSILYVVIELLAVARRLARKYHTSWGLLAGLVLGFATDAVLTMSGS
jgi:zinc transporter, ZIP family